MEDKTAIGIDWLCQHCARLVVSASPASPASQHREDRGRRGHHCDRPDGSPLAFRISIVSIAAKPRHCKLCASILEAPVQSRPLTALTDCTISDSNLQLVRQSAARGRQRLLPNDAKVRAVTALHSRFGIGVEGFLSEENRVLKTVIINK